MKRVPALVLSVLFLLTLFPFFTAAKSGKLDADIAARTRALAVEIETEGVVLLKNDAGVLCTRQSARYLEGVYFI